MSCGCVVVKMVVRGVYVHCAIWITICVQSSTIQIITHFCSNTTTTHRYGLKLIVLTFPGAFYSSRLSLGPYTPLEPLWWQGEHFYPSSRLTQ